MVKKKVKDPVEEMKDEFRAYLVKNKCRYIEPGVHKECRNGEPHFMIFVRALRNIAVLFKNDHGYRITKGQDEYIDYLISTGWIMKIAFSFEDATELIDRYIAPNV